MKVDTLEQAADLLAMAALVSEHSDAYEVDPFRVSILKWCAVQTAAPREVEEEARRTLQYTEVWVDPDATSGACAGTLFYAAAEQDLRRRVQFQRAVGACTQAGELAGHFEVSVNTVMKWADGTARPHLALMGSVIEWLSRV